MLAREIDFLEAGRRVLRQRGLRQHRTSSRGTQQRHPKLEDCGEDLH